MRSCAVPTNTLTKSGGLTAWYVRVVETLAGEGELTWAQAASKPYTRNRTSGRRPELFLSDPKHGFSLNLERVKSNRMKHIITKLDIEKGEVMKQEGPYTCPGPMAGFIRVCSCLASPQYIYAGRLC